MTNALSHLFLKKKNHRKEPETHTKSNSTGHRYGRSTSRRQRESAKTEQSQSFPPKEKETEGQEIAEQWTSKGSCSRGAECDQERRKRKKVTSDRERQVRRIVDGFLRNQRTATKPRRALQKQMIDLLVSTARKDSAQKTQTAITDIFRPAYIKKNKAKQATRVRPFISEKDG